MQQNTRKRFCKFRVTIGVATNAVLLLALFALCPLVVDAQKNAADLPPPNLPARMGKSSQFIPGNKRPVEITGPQTMGDLTRFRRELLYPHTANEFTDITTTKAFHDQPLQFQLPFFGFRYTYFWVHKDGYIAFNQGLLSYKFPVKFPIPPQYSVNKGQDPSMIAPFFAIQDIPSVVPNAGVYLRVIELEKEKNVTLVEGIKADFRDGMIGASNFVPKFVIIVTWKNMTFANKAPDFELKTNTYQVVLATDEIHTYAMFNYDQIDWISGFFEGTKGPSAYVGFNAGNSTRTFEFVPYSQNPRVSLLPTRGYGNGLKGRFFFQIDEEVWSGACIEKDLDPNLPDRLPLTFFPRVGTMLGGTMVNFTGPCLPEDSVIECHFEDWPTKGVRRDVNHASCISPPVMYHGYVDLTIRVNDRTYFYGRFYIQPPDIAVDDIVIINDADREEEPDIMEIKWRPEKLSWNFATSAQISLWGYRETDEVYPKLTFITTLVDSVQLSQTKMNIDLTQFRTRIDTDTTDILFGFIQMNLTNPKILGDFRQSPAIWSRPMPLAWYFKHQWEREYGQNNRWKEYFCNDWFLRESRSDYFATTLFRCPCHYDQAILDVGRFSPDLECNLIDRKCETFHRGAMHCVRTGRPSIGGSGQTCCYDDYKELLQTADTMYGGRPSRAYVYGKHPFKMQMMIPLLSEYLHDVVPFFFCCKWQPDADNSRTCQKYNYWRTSQDCSSYQPPGVASVFGDPHFITFDRTNYTFNGKGEFTLLHVDNSMHKFELQGRFEQLPQPDANTPMLNATMLKAIAAAENTSSTVEFRIRPVAASWRYQMYVIVDQEYVYWWDESMRLQNFRGVTLYQPAGIQNMSHVIAMFDSGAGLEVVADKGFMTVHVYAPYTFLNSTRGLLGNYSKQTWDDFTLPGQEQYLPVNSPPQEIYTRFVNAYRVLDKVLPNDINQMASLFHHDVVDYTFYDDPNFKPDFDPKLPNFAEYLRQNMYEICSDSVACQYDYIITLDPEFAKVTKKAETQAVRLANAARNLVLRCPALPRPMNGRKSENRYWPGTIVRFTCNSGYRLVGYEARRCREDGLWTWGVEAQCISDASYIGEVAGIGLGIIIPIAILITLIILYVVMNRNSQEGSYETYEHGDNPSHHITEAEELNPSEKNSDSLSEKAV